MTTAGATLPEAEAAAQSRGPGAGLARLLPLHWTLWWLIVPNLVIIAMWPIGGPSMAFSIGLCGIAAVIAADLPWLILRRIAIAAIIAFNMLMYIAYSFNLDILGLFNSLDFAAELNPLDSPEYIVAGIVLLASLGLAVHFAPRVPALGSWRNRIRALALVAVLINLDTFASAGTQGSYRASAPAGTPVDSAILQTGIAPKALAARNLVVVIVEAWGVPDNAEDKALFDRAWNASRWSSKFEVSAGTSPYYGSTTSAELREWCGVWADQYSFNFDQARCLPHEFIQAGFETTSIHGFTSGFFNRNQWYPKIGFQKQLFAEDLFKMQTSQCGGVFSGACDRELPAKIGDLLRADPEKRKLVYWLTLNAHMPVPADKSLGTSNCQMGSAQWNRDFPMLCRNYFLQQQLADALRAELMKADFPETDVLIVGDHMPPFFQRTVRSRFDPTRVPWIYLRSRAALERIKSGNPPK